MKNVLQQLKNNESGMSLLLVILILSSLLITVTTISNVTLRVGRSATQIMNSEIAYFAAESAIEKTLYNVEKTRSIDTGGNSCSGYNFEGAGVCGMLDNEDVKWGVKITQNTANIQNISLKSGESYQLELDFDALDLPNKLSLSCPGNAKVIYLKKEGEQIKNLDCTSDIVVGTGGVLRIINEAGADNEIKIIPKKGDGSTGVFTIGIDIMATGRYRNQERRIEVGRINWRIY